MFHKHFGLLLILVLMQQGLWAEITVMATGQGTSRSQAVADALRHAVEQAAGVKIFSESVVKNFVAIQDVIVAESFGMVTSYTVMEDTSSPDGTWTVKVQADVSQDIQQEWGKTQVILEQKGRPSVLLAIREEVDGHALPYSYGENALAEKLRTLGFEVLQNVEFDELPLEEMLARESSQGRDLAIRGILEGKLDGIVDVYGVEYILYQYSFRGSVLRTDTAQEIASFNKEYHFKRQASSASLDNTARAGFEYLVEQSFFDPMVEQMLVTWIRDIQGGSIVHLKIGQVAFSQQRKLLEQLRSLPDLVSSVQVQRYQDGELLVNLKSKIGTLELAEKLETLPDLPLEVVQLSKNTLTVLYKNAD